MDLRYRSIHEYGEDDFEEQKSKFIGYAKPVKTEEEAQAFIAEIGKKHSDATHNCTAYIIDENLKRFDDDGEPSHTAGMPMLTTMEAEGIKEAVVVVTRYFGGTLLGKGGLVRAYTHGCKIALEAAKIVDKVLHKRISLEFKYEYIGILDNYLINNKIHITEKDYADFVSYKIYVELERESRVHQDILDLTSANIDWQEEESLYLSMQGSQLVL